MVFCSSVLSSFTAKNRNGLPEPWDMWTMSKVPDPETSPVQKVHSSSLSSTTLLLRLLMPCSPWGLPVAFGSRMYKLNRAN